MLNSEMTMLHNLIALTSDMYLPIHESLVRRRTEESNNNASYKQTNNEASFRHILHLSHKPDVQVSNHLGPKKYFEKAGKDIPWGKNEVKRRVAKILFKRRTCELRNWLSSTSGRSSPYRLIVRLLLLHVCVVLNHVSRLTRHRRKVLVVHTLGVPPYLTNKHHEKVKLRTECVILKNN